MKHDEIKIPHDHGQDYEKLLEQMPDSDTIKSVSDLLKHSAIQQDFVFSGFYVTVRSAL